MSRLTVRCRTGLGRPRDGGEAYGRDAIYAPIFASQKSQIAAGEARGDFAVRVRAIVAAQGAML
ncbi:hypothetical protein [Mesorhizobium sp. B4-1-4]|uniref:hypothetical protein n=1 Tax=Mesorhizobium sp. B4-1-4 TaxID=2589888 RepID=UPI0011292A0F|nr:hypothetical protein [Mesorhizobium sp. B4-1-4]UCI34372.1 hypothetical protein FJW03_13525 [Mesorhizobium sp. B4-1-4]